VDVRNQMDQRPILLLLERARELYPINPRALTVSQSSRSKLRRDYVGEHLLGADGSLYIIKNISTEGIFGDTIGRKVIGALIGARSIRTELEVVSLLSLAELKTLLIRFVRYDAESNNPNLTMGRSIEAVIERINLAESVLEVILALDLPKLEDCLDVL
jgi:hypothetical protein